MLEKIARQSESSCARKPIASVDPERDVAVNDTSNIDAVFSRVFYAENESRSLCTSLLAPLSCTMQLCSNSL